MVKRRCVVVTGPLAPYAAGFEESLAAQGYRSGRELLGLMAEVSRWLGDRGLGSADLTVPRVEQFLANRRRGRRADTLSMRGVSPLLDHLVGLGVAPVPEPVCARSPLELLVQRYRRYLITERGLASGSVRNYADVATAFLSSASAGPELRLELLDTAAVTEFVLAESQRCKVESAKAMTTRLRSFLRFLYVEGLTPNALAGAVPTVASWRLARLPSSLSPSQVTALLDSCDRETVVGRRDYAIMLVLSRLGLRAGEVARLQLEDFDWHQGELTVRGKAQRQDRLPLPGDVGEAIVAWLRRGRPPCASRSVFIRVRAPQHGLSAGGISAVVRQACGRAGLPPVGAHRLRHTAATQMLQAGASLGEVGQVLRHRSHDTTAIYAKVDRHALAAVVRPWPGSAA